MGAMEETARGDLDDPECEREADLRYRGQSFELGVGADDLDGLAERFHAPTSGATATGSTRSRSSW